MGARKTVRIGVFVPRDTQLLDAACVDIFAMAGHAYLDGIPMLPAAVPALAPDVAFFWVGTAAAGELAPSTAGVGLGITHRLDHPDVQPGRLDIVVVPGVDPRVEEWPADVTAWLAGHAARADTTDVLSICTGIFLCGEAGLLEGRRASGPRGLQDLLRKRYGAGIDLVGDEYRWVRDGNFWSSGGITNGNDLVAAYIKQSKHFPSPVAELACKMADVGERGQIYNQSQTSFTIGVVWQLLKAMVWGVGRREKSS